MSTAYYIQAPKTDLDAIMRQEPVSQIIGKRSAGWSFTFWGDRSLGVKDFQSWRTFITDILNMGGQIVDENGNTLTLDELLAIVESKRGERNKNAVMYAGPTTFLDKDGNDFCEGNWS